LQNSSSLDPGKQAYFLKITKKPETLKLLRTILSDRITSEKTENDTTFLKISLSGNQGTAGTAQWNFYHVAITPDAVLVSTRNETLRELLAQRKSLLQELSILHFRNSKQLVPSFHQSRLASAFWIFKRSTGKP